jgi:hypothetical protein
VFRLGKKGRFYKKDKVSQRQLEQVPELIILTNSRSFKNLKLKKKKRKEGRNI